MKKALIGYTGFVGSNLQAQIKFDDFYRVQSATMEYLLF